MSVNDCCEAYFSRGVGEEEGGEEEEEEEEGELNLDVL